MRLIDADALAEKLKALHGYGDYEANMYCAETCYGLGNWVWENPEDYGVEAAEKVLKNAPTIEAIPAEDLRKVEQERDYWKELAISLQAIQNGRC